MLSPIELKRLDSPNSLFIKWSNGTTCNLLAETLRRSCPCAECREKRGEINHSQPLAAKSKKSRLMIVEHSAEQSLCMTKIWLVGQYALGIAWLDGHDSGIYTFELLQNLAQQ